MRAVLLLAQRNDEARRRLERHADKMCRFSWRQPSRFFKPLRRAD